MGQFGEINTAVVRRPLSQLPWLEWEGECVGRERTLGSRKDTAFK